jgi:amino acid transporter
MTETTASTAAPGLRRDAIGLREVLFQSMTDMAPGAAIAASIPVGVGYAGGALPLSVLIAMVACLLTAFCIGELAKNLPGAGSLGLYVSRGLHTSLGFLTSWGYLLIGLLIPPLVLLQLGFTTASTIHSEWSSYPADLWWPWTVVGALIVVAAGLYGVQTSARLGTVLGLFEIGVFVVLAVLLVVHAGSGNTLSVFSTKYTPSGFRGATGVIGGSVFALLGFGGFEGATPLAEEARDPRRTIRRAVIGATLLIGLLYVLTTYAVDVAYGPGKFSTFTTAGAHSWQGLARSFYGIFWILVFLAIVNSTIANANAGVNVASRTGYAMARIGALPYWFARVHLKTRSPYVAVVVTGALTLLISLVLGAKYNPTSAFGIVGSALVITLVSIYIIVDIACIGFFLRRAKHDFNPLSHILVPVLGVATFAPGWLFAVGWNPFGWSFIASLTYPYSLAVRGVVVWMILGLIYLAVLYVVKPGRVAEMARVHLDEEPTAAEVAPNE